MIFLQNVAMKEAKPSFQMVFFLSPSTLQSLVTYTLVGWTLHYVCEFHFLVYTNQTFHLALGTEGHSHKPLTYYKASQLLYVG